MFLRLPSRSGGQRPERIYGINHGSSLSVGLASWIEPNAGSFLKDNAPLNLACTTTSSPTLVANPLGGTGLYCTGGSGFDLPPSGIDGINLVGQVTQRLVFRPISWPGGFTVLTDDAARVNAAFLNTSGAVSFDGNWLSLINPPNSFTAGLRWDVVIRLTGNGGISTLINEGFLNGVKTGTGGAGGASGLDFRTVTTSFGNNISGGGSNADCVYECVQQWTRGLTDEEIWRLYNSPTRWELYWTPSNRTFFHVPTGVTNTDPPVFFMPTRIPVATPTVMY
jgi:hypothetical protein